MSEPFIVGVSQEAYTGIDELCVALLGHDLATAAAEEPDRAFRLIKDAVMLLFFSSNVDSHEYRFEDGTTLTTEQDMDAAENASRKSMQDFAHPIIVEPIDVAVSIIGRPAHLNPILQFTVEPPSLAF